MKIAVASGKGGTGKTTVATNFARYLSGIKKQVTYVDGDVEEPNGHLFLKPSYEKVFDATVTVPVIDENRCNACGECVAVCQFNALVRLGNSVMVFPELCHGCGGCVRFCPQNAVSEELRVIGEVKLGHSRAGKFIGGTLSIGEAMSPPLIKKVMAAAGTDDITIIDSPPGTSCPVVAVVRDADFVVLVTEPTPFGLHDLGLAVDMVRELKKPFGVVINRDEAQVRDADDFCSNRTIDILARIPDSRLAAEAYSRSDLILERFPEYETYFRELWNTIENRVGQ